MSDHEPSKTEPEAASEVVTTQEEAPPPRPMIVGIGGSAGSIDRMALFFTHIETLSEAAFVIVLTGSARPDIAQFKAKVAAACGLDFALVEDGVVPQPGTLYLAPHDLLLTLDANHFHLRDALSALKNHGAIDTFMVSLATDAKDGAACVILSDVGSDGTLGVAATKEQGGLTLAELSAENAIDNDLHIGRTAAALADFVLRVEDMGPQIASHFQALTRSRNAHEFEDLVARVAPQLMSIATVLRNHTGHDFHGYKRNTFLRRVHRRMQVTQMDTLPHYVDYLRAHPDEAQHLFNDMLIGVTHFFRDAKEFEFFEREIVPELFAGKTLGSQLRIWVLGCATGEEAYSIAILLREYMAKLDIVPHVQIFATDIDGRALAQARVGRYAPSAMREMTPERLARWFIKEGDTYRVVKELREMCIFSQHNVIKDAPFSKLDLISCRNLLIYLNAELQNRILPLFHFALGPSRFLFLGNSENITRHAKLFVAVNRSVRIFRQLESIVRILPEFPLTTLAPLPQPGELTGALIAVGGGSNSLARQTERIIERYTPAYMIIDENHEVLHFSGRTGRFIDPPSGVASLNLLNLIHRDLRLDLRAALHKADLDGEVAQVRGLKLRDAGMPLNITLSVEPIEAQPGQQKRFAVILQDNPDETHTTDSTNVLLTGAPSVAGRDEHIGKLESALQMVRDRLQTTIEELESTNEELKASNEEYQSVNEELQSSNEEIETSKEELQSLNEELQTVNGELAHRVEDLGQANSDLKNLLESTQIATVFLDHDLQIKSFTPAIVDIFHVVDTDLGRPITHIASRIDYAELQSDARQVLRTLSTIKRETRNPQNGLRYLTRVLPYRSVTNVIEGVVMTFLDVTPLYEAEERLRESEARLRAVVENIPQVVWRASDTGQWTWVSRQWTQFTGQSRDEALGIGWLEKVHPQDREAVLEKWTSSDGTGHIESAHRLWNRPTEQYRTVMLVAAFENAGGDRQEWFGSTTDMHESMMLQNRQQLLLDELQHRVRNSLAVIRSIARRSAESSTSVEDYAAHLEGRINALTRTQNILTRAPDAEVDLYSLILEELRAQGARANDDFTLAGDDISLSGKAAETLSLSIHELVTNALKYGALSNEGGMIAISWLIDKNSAQPALVLTWTETLSQGTTIVPPARRGFGMELIERSIPYEVGGSAKLDFRPQGLQWLLRIPLSDKVKPRVADHESAEIEALDVRTEQAAAIKRT